MSAIAEDGEFREVWRGKMNGKKQTKWPVGEVEHATGRRRGGCR